MFFENNSASRTLSKSEGANGTNNTESNALVYHNNSNSALAYSEGSYQSENGFRLIIEFKTAQISNHHSLDFSFGLISDDTELSKYKGDNPF